MRRQRLLSRPRRIKLLVAIAMLCMTASSYAQWTETVLHALQPGSDGAFPFSPLIADSAGNLYGTTGGGTSNRGTVFELSPNSGSVWTETILYTFNGPDGNGPEGLVLDSAGNLYGTAGQGGAHGKGVVFELSPGSGGWTETILHNFTGGDDGGLPDAGVILDSSGNLYGTTGYGGTGRRCGAGCGTVFELTPSSGGWTENVLYSFNGQPNDGNEPRGTLVFDKVGNLYGTTYGGGTDQSGTVFELSPSAGGSWTESVIHNFQVFNGTRYDGEWPMGGLAIDDAGDLYGTTLSGGNHFKGTVFKLTHSTSGWEEDLIYVFRGGSDGESPYCTPVFTGESLYGTTAFGGAYLSGLIFKIGKNSDGKWEESTLHSFMPREGGDLLSGVLLDSAGNIYGTAEEDGPNGYGTAFELSQSAAYDFVLLHSFTGTPQGELPSAGLAIAASGSLYGIAGEGGSHNAGAIFQVAPTSDGWNYNVLFNFDGGVNGSGSQSPLIPDSAGNLYGTAPYGGTAKCRCGLIFELSPDSSGGWVQSILHSFSGTPDADHPYDGLAFDLEGNLYGTTYQGGTFGQGAVFQLTPTSTGWVSNVIYSFTGGADGGLPQQNVALDANGNVYGMTPKGGAYANGTVFEVSPTTGGGWSETVLYNFAGDADGSNPYYGLTLDSTGNLYGTTSSGGTNGLGTVFQLMPISGGWQKNILLNFSGGSGGQNPYGNLTFDSAGNLYGLAGDSSDGEDLAAVYELSPSGISWTETVLYTFTKNVNAGSPVGDVVFDSLGNLYGATTYGGGSDIGVVFRLSP